jgi:hypothetical protein
MSVNSGAKADPSRHSAADTASDGTGQLYFGNAWVIYGTMYAVSDGAAGSLSPVGLFEWTPVSYHGCAAQGRMRLRA